MKGGKGNREHYKFLISQLVLSRILILEFKGHCMRFLVVFIIFSCIFSTLSAQDQMPAKLKIYLDCSAGCDQNHIRSEITLVDFVLDRLAADIHLLITSTVTGAGGLNFQIIFFGQNKFNGQTDTISFPLSPNTTEVERRIEILKRIQFGLIPYISQTPYSDFIDIKMNMTKVTGNNKSLQEDSKDKWNYWVYNLSMDGTYNTDQIYKSSQARGTFSINRITDRLKINFSIYGNHNSSSYQYEDNGIITKYKVTNSDYQINHYLISSINQHWSYGYELSYSNSTFSNNKNRKYISTGFEYAIFPYKDVNNKFFTINYSLNLRHNIYYDTTIYNKMSELLPGHILKIILTIKQKWGNIDGRITYSNYFKDFSLNNISLDLLFNIRITGGLSFYIYSYGSLVHDQVYLAKGNATPEEILTRRRQLASSYNFNTGIGLNFRFGSMLNNFVNPRFSYY